MSPDLDAALTRAAAADVLLVASDFDGVLAPFVLDPLDARAQDGTVEDLAALAALPRTYAAVVSGRDLETLTSLTGLTALSDEGHAGAAEVTRIGSHGGETSRATGALVGDEERDRLRQLVAAVEAAVEAREPRIRLEHKPAAVVLHTRGLDDDARIVATEIAEGARDEIEGVRLLAGKGVCELSVVQADKGSALRALADEVGADAVVYLGDDVTDEHAFAVLGDGDVGIKVGDGETAAGWRVDTCEEVPAVIARLRERRAAALG